MQKMLFAVSAAVITLYSPTAFEQTPPANPYLAFMRMVDCSGHTGRTTVCFKNATTYTIIKARCGGYDVPILTADKKIAPGEVAALIDLGDSVRTCRREGVTAATDVGVMLKAPLNGATVDDSTEVVFLP